MDKEKIEEAKKVLYDFIDFCNSDLSEYPYRDEMAALKTILQYTDKLENMYNKEHTEHLYHKENSDKFFNQFNRLQIKIIDTKRLIDRYNYLDYISAHETIEEIEKLLEEENK